MKYRWGILLLVIGLVLLPTAQARADMGPKPQADFEFDYEIERVLIVSGQLLSCYDGNCTTSESLPYLRVDCTAYECHARSFTNDVDLKLIIVFSDGTSRESNVFTQHAFNARFKVTVRESSLVVREVPNPLGNIDWPGFVLAIFVTLPLEAIISGLYAAVFKLTRRVMLWMPFASVFTLVILWVGLPSLGLSEGWTICGGELLVVALEAGFVYGMARKRIPLKRVLLLSIVANVSSFVVGLMIGAVLSGPSI